MKPKIIIIFVLVVSFTLSGCEKLFMHDEPENSKLYVFNEYSKLCTEKFGLEKVKGVDLKTLVDSIRPFINENLTDKELLEYMGIIVNRMQEGHTMITNINTEEDVSYSPFMGYPASIGSATFKFYLSNNPSFKKIGNAAFDSYRPLYGKFPTDTSIGFIYIPSFTIQVNNEEFEQMLSDLQNTKGLVIDIRSNLGGYIEVAARLASYFTEKPVEFAVNNIKNGPGKNDFASNKMVLNPSSGKVKYLKPVIVIQNRFTFSTGSLFSAIMSAIPQVKLLGQITGGGTGDIIYGYLSNGWKYSLSTSNFVDHNGNPTDNGIEPAIPLAFNLTDTVDTYIAGAIKELE
jgi:hypothetical protein